MGRVGAKAGRPRGTSVLLLWVNSAARRTNFVTPKCPVPSRCTYLQPSTHSLRANLPILDELKSGTWLGHNARHNTLRCACFHRHRAGKHSLLRCDPATTRRRCTVMTTAQSRPWSATLPKAPVAGFVLRPVCFPRMMLCAVGKIKPSSAAGPLNLQTRWIPWGKPPSRHLKVQCSLNQDHPHPAVHTARLSCRYS